MNRINDFNIEPGVYIETQGNGLFVVTDIVNYRYCPLSNSVEVIDPPLVVVRPLTHGKHIVIAYPKNRFEQIFTKH